MSKTRLSSSADAGDVIDLDEWRRRAVVENDVRAALELAYELAQQIAALDLPSAFPAFSQQTTALPASWGQPKAGNGIH
jgi:hypothetical protein